MKWLKYATQGSGWAAMAAAIITLLLKVCGIEVDESAVLPLIVSAIGLVQGGNYIPVIDKAIPVMPDMQNRTLDAIYHLDKTLSGDEVVKAISVLWNAARTLPKHEGK